MNNLILTCVFLAVVGISRMVSEAKGPATETAEADAGIVEKRGLLDFAAKLYSDAWGTFLPDSTRETCRGLGWVNGPNVKDSGSVLDALVPKGLAHMMGAGHQGVFPESMEASFCTTAGMVKPGPPPATPQITGVFGMWNNQKVLVTEQGQVYDLSANFLGTTNQIGPIQYMQY